MTKGLGLALFVLIFLNGCGGSSSTGGQDGGCTGSCSNQLLTTNEVQDILKRVVKASRDRNVAVNASVIDRVGNVLAVYRMNGAVSSTRIDGKIGAAGGLEQASVPAVLAAISKAGTGAYLSSQGNAFSTRTASQIVQENFVPGEKRQPGGPLSGVQFSQLPCSDLMNRGGLGPKPLPLGLSADPGGIPLYKNGDLVGGLGIELDGLYTLDREIQDFDSPNLEETIAMEAAFLFQAPSDRVADKMFVLGRSLRFSDATYPASDPVLGQELSLDLSGVVKVAPFFNGVIRSGVTFGNPESGIIKSTRAGAASAVLASVGSGARSGAANGTKQLTASEVSAVLDSALLTSERTRAAIRRPLDSGARVSIFVVDHLGTILGFTRSEDAPVFGIDVALQKARTAAFFSSANAGNKIAAFGPTAKYANGTNNFAGRNIFDGSSAITSRAIGNLARPFFPDGINENSHGPLSLPFPGRTSGSSWSPFNTGLQLDLILARVVAPLAGSIPSSCTDSGIFGRALANGIQIFPGSAPLYKDGVLVGAIGVSGDGIDQDDLISYFGASREGLNYAGHTGIGNSDLGFHAPRQIRSDTLEFPGTATKLRYVNCPEAPFIEDNGQNVCN